MLQTVHLDTIERKWKLISTREVYGNQNPRTLNTIIVLMEPKTKKKKKKNYRSNQLIQPLILIRQ